MKKDPLEWHEFDFNGEHFAFLWDNDESDWDDEGKYQFQTLTYQLVSYNLEIKDYPDIESITGNYDILVDISVARTGSYYSDYYYSYSDISIRKIEIKHVPEQVIPAHDEVIFKCI